MKKKTSKTIKPIDKGLKANNGYVGYRVKKRTKIKQGWYKGWWCDSSYELAFIIYNLDHNIKFVRNTDKFSYTYLRKEYKWMPDFKLEDGTYIEIKGLMNRRNSAKFNSFPGNLKVLMKEELKPYFLWCIEKYGKDWVKLLEGKK